MALKPDRTIYESEKTFALGTFEAGTPVFEVEGQNEAYPVVSNKRSEIFLGFSLQNVVDIDSSVFHSFNEVFSGGLLQICTHGTIVIQVPKKWGKLPIGQPLYSTRDGKLSWKAIGPRVCIVVGKVDEDGFVKVRVGA